MRKLWSKLRWALYMLIPLMITYGGFAGLIVLINLVSLIFGVVLISWWWLIPTLVITSWVGFTLLYPFRKTFIRKWKPFWYYFDDEDEFGYNIDWFYPNKKNGFIKAWLWAAARNPMWNLHASLSPKQGDKEIVEIKKLTLKRNGSLVGDPFIFAVLKYIDDNGTVGNKGTYLSSEHSIVGESYVWYRINGTLYWRKSKVFYRNGRWHERQSGTNDFRYTLRRKHSKKNLIWR